MISFTTELLGDYARIGVRGDVDFSTTDRLVSTVAETIEAGARTIDLEMADVQFIDSTGIGGLLRLRKRSEAQQISFRLMNCSPGIRDILRLTGLDSVLTLVSEEEP